MRLALEARVINPLPGSPCGGVNDFLSNTLQEVSESQSAQDPVGRPMMHRSALAQATGEAVFCDDMPPIQGELFLALVTSTRPHASIL